MNFKQYCDKYFVRSKRILELDNFNPVVRYQVFIRGDAFKVGGINEAVKLIKQLAPGTQISAVPEGTMVNSQDPKETIMILEGPIQELIEIETLYLGIISAASSPPLDFNELAKNAQAIVRAAEDKPVTYFGARHFHYSQDEKIASICKKAGMAATSTDAGAKAWNSEGVGTIPHALILAYNSTLTATLKFHQYIDAAVPRVALIDTFNREIEDSLAVCRALGKSLNAVRLDTPGETQVQGSEEVPDKELDGLDEHYRRGNGVRISGAWALRRALDEAGFKQVGLFLSSGFNAAKTKAFVKADKQYKQKYGNDLFVGIGTGSIAPKIRFGTSDIVAIKEKGKWVNRSKVGRLYTYNSQLRAS